LPRLRIQNGKHTGKRVVRGKAIGKTEKRAEPILFAAPEKGNLGLVFRTANDGANGYD
jgi:hypothetical protein